MGIRSKRALITRHLTPDLRLECLVQGFPSFHHLRVQPRKPRQRHRVEIDPHLLRLCRSSSDSTSSTIYSQTFPSPAINSLFLLPSSTLHPQFFYSLQTIAIMSLSNKLSIADVDVKGKKVLIRVSTRSEQKLLIDPAIMIVELD